MKVANAAKASVFSAALMLACLLPSVARAQADAMPSPEDYPFSAPEPSARTAQPAGEQQAKADFQGAVSLPYGVNCAGKDLGPGRYLLSVRSVGSARVVTFLGSGVRVSVHVREMRSNGGESRSALLVRKSGEARRLEGIYVQALNAMLYLDASRDQAQAAIDRLPIS
jgi:hypothetical protein